jgi:hypothetical protein
VKNSKLITFLAITAITASIISIGLVFNSTKTLFNVISGYATSTGEANLTIETVVAINFTTSHVNWGSGRVNAGEQNATLETQWGGTGSVLRGNWTVVTDGLAIENTGNVNVTLNMSGTKTAAQMIGGTNPEFKWFFTQGAGSPCRNASSSPVDFPSNFQSVPTSTNRTCDIFTFIDSADSFTIDFHVVVPSDSFTGALGDTITATAFAVP